MRKSSQSIASFWFFAIKVRLADITDSRLWRRLACLSFTSRRTLYVESEREKKTACVRLQYTLRPVLASRSRPQSVSQLLASDRLPCTRWLTWREHAPNWNIELCAHAADVIDISDRSWNYNFARTRQNKVVMKNYPTSRVRARSRED